MILSNSARVSPVASRHSIPVAITQRHNPINVQTVAVLVKIGDVPRRVASQLHYGGDPGNLADEEVTLSPEVASSVLMELTDPRGKHFARMRHESLPPEHLFGRRLEILTLAVLGQLEPTNNWHRIAREWMYGDAPVTELGRAEADFFATAPA